MKITSDNPMLVSTTAQPATSKGSQSASSAANTTVTKSTPSAGVAVTVSTLARALGSASRAEAADVDMEKVNAVRAAIKKGTFVVNPEAIADKLLGNAQEMLDRTRS
jgi:negative regulator of flagellin synthesis FlgM